MSNEHEADTRRYARTFLLRWWQDAPGTRATWRFSLEEIGGQMPRRGFASLKALTTFLSTELSHRGNAAPKQD